MFKCYASSPSSSNAISANTVNNSLRSITLSAANNVKNPLVSNTSSSPVPPPIPPRSATATSHNRSNIGHIGSNSILIVGSPKRPSSAASAISTTLTTTASTFAVPSNNHKNRDNLTNVTSHYVGGLTESAKDIRISKQSSNSSRPGKSFLNICIFFLIFVFSLIFLI